MDPVLLSPTNAIAFISGCSVKALPASSPNPLTVFRTPGGRPASSAISTSKRAVRGEASAGLWTTVQPAASAGAIFQVDSMKGVFHGVIIPTGPIGTLVVIFIRVGDFKCFPSRAAETWSAKYLKFSAPRKAAFDIKRQAWPVSQHSHSAISSARASIPSAILIKMAFRSFEGISRQSGKADFAACAALCMSSEFPRATVHISDLSTGDIDLKVPELPFTSCPAIRCWIPFRL